MHLSGWRGRVGFRVITGLRSVVIDEGAWARAGAGRDKESRAGTGEKGSQLAQLVELEQLEETLDPAGLGPLRREEWMIA